MIIVDVEQRSPQWLALRRGAITASAADRLLTPAKLQTYALELATERLVREIPPNIVTPAMAWGIEHEDEARLRYAFEENREGQIFDCGFAWHDDWEGWIGCSPDGLVSAAGLVEIKCPTSKVHLSYLAEGACPQAYLPQVQFQLWVTGRAWCDFVSYDPRFTDGDYFCAQVARDEQMIAKLEAGAAQCMEQIQSYLDKVHGRKS